MRNIRIRLNRWKNIQEKKSKKLSSEKSKTKERKEKTIGGDNTLRDDEAKGSGAGIGTSSLLSPLLRFQFPKQQRTVRRIQCKEIGSLTRNIYRVMLTIKFDSGSIFFLFCSYYYYYYKSYLI